MNKSFTVGQKNVHGTVLAIILAAVSLLISYAITRYGDNMGMVILGGLIGIGLVLTCLTKPEAGFYICISLAFIISVFERLLFGIITFDIFVEILVLATLGGTAYKKYFYGEPFWKGLGHPITYFVFGYFVYIVLEIFNPNAFSIPGGFFMIRKTMQLLAIFLIAFHLFHSTAKVQSFIYFWILISGLCGAYACYQQWVGFQPFELEWLRSSELRVDIYQLDDGTFRKFSTLTDPAAFGILMAVSALLSLVVFLKAPAKGKKTVVFLALIFQVLGMSYSSTRTATAALLAGIALYILMTVNEIRTLIFAIFCALVLFFVLFAPIYGNVTINRIRSTFNFTEDNSYSVREENRSQIQPYIRSQPIGGGLLTSGTAGRQYHPGHRLAGFPTDSGFLKVATELGWIGLGIVCCMFFVILQQGVHQFFSSRDPMIKPFLLAAVVALFGNMAANYSQAAIGPSPQIFLYYPLLALLVVFSKKKSNIN